jgi:hypothetical protein
MVQAMLFAGEGGGTCNLPPATGCSRPWQFAGPALVGAAVLTHHPLCATLAAIPAPRVEGRNEQGD